ncbi:PepSY-associated TM helix domain-containing protein [Thauera sp. SDU_THAU2]|uniref:PepSY-associated TM helix domain-containing protein n=1 Tax=Thauera sp. SDU_THAU2 TaxID=3136633 RepID=UPI00311FE70D
MKEGFRARMGDVHTWAGLVLSALLFAIFWTGTLSVFDKEIDRWMMPETRIAIDVPVSGLSVDKDVLPLLLERAPASEAWSIVLPGERAPFLSLAYETEGSPIPRRVRFHPLTLEPLPASHTRGASQFIYPFHHNLTLRKDNIGAWLVGIASIGMLCLLVSGVVIHRKLFADFFTLRLFRRFGRANLDVHNLSGVMLLPFAIVITLSGLVIAHLIYFPQVPDAVFAQVPAQAAAEARPRPAAGEAARAREARGTRQGEGRAARQGEARGSRHGEAAAVRSGEEQEEQQGGEAQAESRGEGARNSPARRQFLGQALGRVKVPLLGQPAGGIASIDAMIAATEREWGPGTISMVRISNPGDAGGVAAVRPNNIHNVTQRLDNKRFSLATGEPIKSFEATPTVNVWSFIAGMHYLQFSHWSLRWLYFLGGLGGCVMIATGLLHWTQARNKGKRGAGLNVALMNVLNIGTVTGIIAATGAFLLANRALDGREQFAGIASRDLEVDVFFHVWLLCALHALARVLWQRRHGHLRAWAEQCRAIAAIAAAAVGLNWLTTGDHLLRTVFTGIYWPVAATDLGLLSVAAIALWAARKLKTAYGTAISEANGTPGKAVAAAVEVAHV